MRKTTTSYVVTTCKNQKEMNFLRSKFRALRASMQPPPAGSSLSVLRPLQTKRSQHKLAMTVAEAVLSDPSLGVRTGVAYHGVHHASHVLYWLNKWKGTEMDDCVAAQKAEGVWPHA